MKKKLTIGYVILSLFVIGSLYNNNTQNEIAITQLENKIDNVIAETATVQKEENVSLNSANIETVSTQKEGIINSNYDQNEIDYRIFELLETTNTSAKQEHVSISKTVYLTNTGKKYHASGCRYLKNSCTPVSLDQAISMGKTPCSVCKP